MNDRLSNRLPEIEVCENDPYKGDRLGRAQYASTLTNIVNAYSETGCVLSINGEWGTGKTTFVKMWQADLKRQKFRTIYYNAWETDYIEDPFISLLGELKNIVGDDAKFRKVSSSIGRIFLSVGKSFIKNKAGIDVDEVTTEIGNQIDAYSQQKTSFNDFKKALVEYVANVDEDEKLPVIFIIDELDRCSPNYAVKVLERVKHLFDIPNIIFVLPISKKQLEYSIQGFYGSDKIDAPNYLRRFIDLEFELPNPDYDTFYSFLYEHYRFNDFFKDKYDKGNHHVRDSIDLLKSMVVKLCKHKKIELRTMDKMFVLCRLVATEVNGSELAEMDLFFLLCYLKIYEYDLYCDIKNHRLKLQDLVERFESVFPRQLLTSDNNLSLDHHSFLYAIASLLYAYNQLNSIVYEEGVLPSVKKPEVNLNCTVIDKAKLEEGLKYATSHIYHWNNISDITDKIDLLRIR